MGGYDFNIALSASSSATSGLEDAGKVSHGDFIANGTKLPKWTVTALIVGLFVTAIVFIVRRK